MYNYDRVLLTYGWCRNAWAIMRNLSKRGLKVYVGDTDKTCMSKWSRHKSGFFIYPDFRTKEIEFVDSVANYLRKNQIGVYLPVHEEIMSIARYRDRLPQEVCIPISEYQTIYALYNKHQLCEIAESLSINYPRTLYPQNTEELKSSFKDINFPLIVKMQNSNGAKGVQIVQKKDEALRAWANCKQQTELNPIVQEYVNGRMYAVSLLADQGKEIARFVRRNLREKEYFGGTCTKAESVYHNTIADEAMQILKQLEYTGVVMFEFLVNEDSGEHWLIEANPRYWGTTPLDLDVGVDFPYYHYQIAIGQPPGPVYNYSAGIKSRWIIGDMISLVNNFKTPKGLKRPYSEYFSFGEDYYMDLKKDDIGAFFGEATYYLKKFIKYRSTNPMEEGISR